MKNNIELAKSQEQKELPRKFDRIYVLAHGEPDRPLSVDSKIRILAAMELAGRNSEAEIFFVGGGQTGQGKPTSQQMLEYFERINHSSKNRIPNKTKILDKSNNTVANIEEILESLDNKKEETSIAILSNEYHRDRINEILCNLDASASVLPAEELLKKRSTYHKNFVKKYEGTLGYKEKEIIDKLMCVYLKIDPKQSLVKKYRSWRRKK